MPKRLTDTEKWIKPWFRKLAPKWKLAWTYILDSCDHAGVWPEAFDLMSLQVGETVTADDFNRVFAGRVIALSDDKYFIPSFIEFQYPKGLNPKNNAHRKAIAFLKANPSLVAPGMKLISPSPGAVEEEVEVEVEVAAREGGAGETKPAAPAPQAPTPPAKPEASELRSQIETCFATYGKTLEHFKTHREPDTLRDDKERLKIGRMIQQHGVASVKLALAGRRAEVKGEGYDPAQHLALSQIFDPKKFDRLVILGQQYISSQKPKDKPQATGPAKEDLPPPPADMTAVSAALGRYSKGAVKKPQVKSDPARVAEFETEPSEEEVAEAKRTVARTGLMKNILPPNPEWP